MMGGGSGALATCTAGASGGDGDGGGNVTWDTAADSLTTGVGSDALSIGGMDVRSGLGASACFGGGGGGASACGVITLTMIGAALAIERRTGAYCKSATISAAWNATTTARPK